MAIVARLRSGEFRTKWGDHDVRRHATGVKRFHHPIFGDPEFLFEGTELMVDAGWTLRVVVGPSGIGPPRSITPQSGVVFKGDRRSFWMIDPLVAGGVAAAAHDQAVGAMDH
ncbi:hypothetical protein ACFRJ8_12280 [Arthrobacter sp. NPDC056886]|uniref:MmyB family transcriptional regulator n=1 Tax=Arthrobacter sp. NPDC056886 TaxID=3345960 RepID=UPI00366D8F34